MFMFPLKNLARKTEMLFISEHRKITNASHIMSTKAGSFSELLLTWRAIKHTNALKYKKNNS